MRCVIQRVSEARVVVEGQIVGEVGAGLLVLVCALRGDTPREARRLAERVAGYRVFPDAEGRMNLSALDRGLPILVVSQFTLAADGRKGRRPSFDAAAPPAEGRALVECFRASLQRLGIQTEAGVFGAAMRVELVNEGPATFVLEDPPQAAPGGAPTSQVVA
ncbi:MAG: D-tyrosyl-tRNA(Tyr) deacylase [Planctomycetes bacterium]|nr:D-tyrosyl-tRNA(Tyr) deacylase [Planctomycetota bacterium]